MNPLIFFGLTIILLIITIVLYTAFDVRNQYVYWILGGLAGLSFITTLTIIVLRPSQRQRIEQKQKNYERSKYKPKPNIFIKNKRIEYKPRQKSPPMTLEECNRWKCNEELGLYTPIEYKMLTQRNRDLCKCKRRS